MNSGLPPARRGSTAARPSGSAPAGKRPAQVRLDRGVGQAADGERLGDAAHAEVVGQRGDRGLAVLAGGPERAEHEQPRRVAAAQHRVEQVERRVVGPVEVLEHEQRRARRR